MDELELNKRIIQWEDSSQEFKSKKLFLDKKAKSRHELDIAAECVAFLNKNGGTIFFGIEDDRNIDGLSSEELELVSQSLSSLVKDKINPPIIVETENIVTKENGIVIAMTVPKGIDKPYQTSQDGKFYIRSGHEKVSIKHREELRRLFQEGVHVYAEKKVLTNTTLSDLNLIRIKQFYEDGLSRSMPDEEGLYTELANMHLISGEQLTTVGCLLFANTPQSALPSFNIKCIRFKGTDLEATEFYESQLYEGTIQELYQQANSFLKKWNTLEQEKGSSFNDKGTHLVNPIVFEEILINALVHRDYFINDGIKVLFFDDRVEIISPGSLPNSLSLDELLLYAAARERNPILSRISYHILDYKGVGSGIRRSRKLHPSIHFENNSVNQTFRVIIPYN